MARQGNGSTSKVVGTALPTPTAYTWTMLYQSAGVPGATATHPLSFSTSGLAIDFGFSWGHNDPNYRQAAEHKLSGGSYVACKLTSTLSPATWYRITCTWDGSNLRIYLGSTLEATTPCTSIAGTSPIPTALVRGAGDFGFDPGTIAEMAYWNSALSIGDITLLSNNAVPTRVSASTLRLYWPMRSTTATEPDLSGNSITGTATATTSQPHPNVERLFRPIDTLASPSAHLTLQDETVAPPTTARISTGWIVGSLAPTLYARMDSQFERASSAHTSTVQPSSSPDNTLGDCLRTGLLTGSFSSGNWLLSLEVQGETRASSTHDGRLRIRVWKSATSTGASPTELTTSTLLTPTYTNLTNSTPQTLSVTWAAPAFSLSSEYLFVQISHELTGAGSHAASDTHLRVGANNSISTTAFSTILGATVALTATSSLSVPAVTVTNSAAFTSTSNLTASTQDVSSTYNDTYGDTYGSTSSSNPGAANLTATSSLAATPSTLVIFGTAALTGTSTLTSSYSSSNTYTDTYGDIYGVEAGPGAVLLGNSTLVATGTIVYVATVALTATATLTSTPVIVYTATATLTSSGTLTSAATTTYLAQPTTLTSTSTLISAALLTAFAEASVSATSSLSSTGLVIFQGGALLTSTSNVTSSSTQASPSGVTLSGRSDLTATPITIAVGVGSLTSTSSLTADSFLITLSLAALTSTSALSASATTFVPGAEPAPLVLDAVAFALHGILSFRAGQSIDAPALALHNVLSYQ